MMSFCTTKNECCNDDEEDANALCAAGCCCACCPCCYECSFTFSGIFFLRGTEDPRMKITMAFVVAFLLIFLIMYIPIKACGKHATRIVSLVGLFLVNVALTVMGFISGKDKFCILLAVFSLVTAFLNFLGIILPNCECCERLSYEHLYDTEQMTKVESNPQQLLILPPQNEMSHEEATYTKPEEVVENPINKSITPNNTDPNPGYDNNNNINSINSPNAPAPIYQIPENEYINQVDTQTPIYYPKPQ